MPKKATIETSHRSSSGGRYEVRLVSRNKTVTVSSPVRAKILEQTEKLIAASERKSAPSK
ncbi:hypothetical protein LFT48_17500 [Arthrobacter sp. FW305-123]|uniref:hypothetical protein n=1 Tax=Paenarthrobacter sp. NPDC091711 TaxID=3364385 RepID=UPI00382BB5D0|nr:hypothetical protein LFT48_17500 [Arthrobacter sp. FW305-123]